MAPDRTLIRKKSVLVAGHPTSVSLEAGFWQALQALAGRRGQSLNALVTSIDATRTANLSSALRVFVLDSLSAGEG
jgi:predicted DNA-binding ribbon-helix-helix protein